MCLSDINSRKSKADTFVRESEICLEFIRRNSMAKFVEL